MDIKTEECQIQSKEKLELLYDEAVPAFTEILDRLTELIRETAQNRDLNVTIRSRVKKFSSWHAKLIRSIGLDRERLTSHAITDILGIRVICPFLEEVDLISAMLQELFKVQEHEIKGANYPYQHFGYESVHFLIEIPDIPPALKSPAADFLKLTVCEIQVRTTLQEAWAEVEHELVYKSDFSPLDEPLKRKLAALNANLTLSDIMFQEIRDYQRKLNTALKERRKAFYSCLSEAPEDSRVKDLQGFNVESGQNGLTRETVDTLVLRGLLAHNKKQYNEAIEIYSNILLRDIGNDIRAVVLVHRGMAYFSSDMHEKALDDFNKAIELDPGQVKARYYRAVHARVNKNFSEAFEDIGECLKNEPYSLEYLTARAETLAASGETPAARQECLNVLRLDPDFKPAQRLLTDLEKS